MAKILHQAQFFQWKRFNLKTKKNEIILVQGSLRPSLWGAYEYVFPEESLSEVLSMFGVNLNIYSKATKIQSFILRKLFPGVKKIPKKNLKEAMEIPSILLLKGCTRGLNNLQVPGVQIIPIGIKYDNRNKWEEKGYEQEML